MKNSPFANAMKKQANKINGKIQGNLAEKLPSYIEKTTSSPTPI